MYSNRFSIYSQKDVDFYKLRIEIPYIYKRTKILFDSIFPTRSKTILEVGCGEGIALKYINPINYIGIDTSFVRLKFGSTLNKNHSFIQADGKFLPFSSGKFDIVFSMGTFHHLTKEGCYLMLKEMGRVCKEGGYVVIIEPNFYNPSSFLLALFRKIERGIFHCKPEVFLKYFKELGIFYEINLIFNGTFSPIFLLTYLLNKTNFIKTFWFNKLWERIDIIVNKLVPEKFWTSFIIKAMKCKG